MTDLQKEFEETGYTSWINADLYPDGKIYTQEYTQWLEKQVLALRQPPVISSVCTCRSAGIRRTNFQLNNKIMSEEKNINEPQSPAFLQAAVMRRATGIMFKGKELLDGDIVAQHCQMIDDYTGKTSIELNRLLISWNGKNWDVKCIDAMVGYRNNFWGYIPRFHELVGNAIDNSELLCGGAVWKPYA